MLLHEAEDPWPVQIHFKMKENPLRVDLLVSFMSLEVECEQQ